MDPAVCLEHEIRKAQINRESVVAVFFDIEKAYDMMWREGLLIKLCKLGIKGQMYRWINNFLSGRAIKVRIGKVSEKFVIGNGTPQGSIVSPLLFSIMINVLMYLKIWIMGWGYHSLLMMGQPGILVLLLKNYRRLLQ